MPQLQMGGSRFLSSLFLNEADAATRFCIGRQEYPSAKSDRSTRVHLGLAMRELGYDHVLRKNIYYYKIIPKKVA